MKIFALIPLCLMALFLILLLKKERPEYSYFISLVVGALLLLCSVKELEPILGTIKSFFQKTNLPIGYIEVLFKALGICYLTELGSEICKDAGENAISTKLELAGKLSVIAVSLPLFNDVLSAVVSLIRF